MSAPVVVKLGSSLVVRDGRPDGELLAGVAEQLAGSRPAVIVSSGAIALGSPGGPPRGLAALQAASALGQPLLHRAWEAALGAAGVPSAQVLLSGADVAERRSYVNVRNALHELLRRGVVPVLNENDATATDEISFGDNDVLAAQVAVLLRARMLVLLTAVEGVLAGDEVVADGALARDAPLGPGSALGRGGMESKIAASELASAGGVPTAIASPSSLGVLLQGGDAGTRFAAHETDESAFKLWLRYGKRVVGEVEVDEGARRAVAEDGRSLLAVGVVSWTGDFRAGDGVAVRVAGEPPFARGIASVDAGELAGRPAGVEVLHRDRLVLL